MLFWIVGAALAGTTKCQCQWTNASTVAAFSWPSTLTTVAQVRTPNGSTFSLACGTISGDKRCAIQNGGDAELAHTNDAQIKKDTLAVSFPGTTTLAGEAYPDLSLSCAR